VAMSKRAVNQLIEATQYVPDAIIKLRELIESLRKPGAATQKQLDDLKQAIELQLTVNNKINEQLQLIKSVLEDVQRSLKIIRVTAVATGLIAVLALILAVTK
jgi:hypothetical protein